MTGAIYLESTEYYLHDRTKLLHILLNTLFNHLSSPDCSPMNCAICNKHTSRSLRKACVERTCDSHNVIESLPSVILSVCPWSALLVFSFLCGVLLILLSSTQKVSISGRDDESPRKRGVAGMVGSGAGSMVFNIDTTGWSGGICITAPVEWTIIQLAAGDAHNAGHSPGAFPFGSATFMSFLLPIHPSNLLHFAFAFMHSLHICLGSLIFLTQPALGHMCAVSRFILHGWTTYHFDDNVNVTHHELVRALDSTLLVCRTGLLIRHLPCTAPLTCTHWVCAWARALFPSPLPCLTLPHHWVIRLVWMTWMGQFVTLLQPISLLLPFVLCLCATLLLLSST